jgi:hypothetical protein
MFCSPTGPIIGRMTDETAALIDRVRAMIDGQAHDPAAIEDALTDGYARALALEAERRRLELRITELAVGLSSDRDGERVSELEDLAGRRSRADRELSRLRGALGSLREHLAARRAQPSSAS